MIYTLGKVEVYGNGDGLEKAEGGSVWKTFKAACAYRKDAGLSSRIYHVYGVAAEWNETREVEDIEDKKPTWRMLRKDTAIIPINQKTGAAKK